MKPFLREIAEYYVARHADELADYCFVFPNKRSGAFFSHFLAEVSLEDNNSMLHPEVMTISDLILELTDVTEASRLEQLFILYHCYKKIVAEETIPGAEPHTIDFNRFRFWGEVLINDFIDVDKYLVNPEELFHNIDALKEINSDFLLPEQLAVIERYWGADKIPSQVSDFWRHVIHTSNNPELQDKRISTTSFIRLWQIMNRLYVSFREELCRRGLAYQGMMYRDALEQIESSNPDEFPYKKYVFIGFNVLSTVEERIFAALRDKRCADFFWDYVSPAFADNGNRATAFLSRNIREFPHPGDAVDVGVPLKSFPEIEVVAVPSVIGQVKIAAQSVESLFPRENYRPSDLLSTAIVLPDETLALPVIDSLPEYIRDINVTMGYPMRNTPVASLINSIRVMHLKARHLHGELTYFHEDVRAVLSHPLVRSVVSRGVIDSIISALNKNRVFNVPVSMFDNVLVEALRPLFAPISPKASADEVFNFLENLCLWLISHVRKSYTLTTDTHLDADSEDMEENIEMTAAGAIDIGFLRHYLAAISELKRLRLEHRADLDVDLEESTVFGLIEKLIGGESVRFEGMPLQGLQIIGALETRALDFDNILILSMNERIFPRKHFSKSFIPPALRAAYGMSTLDHQESISAYYFYRLISRARKVTLLYDSRTSGLSSGEPSRYINQLRYLYSPCDIKFRVASYRLTTRRQEPVSVKLSKSQKAKLREYLTPSSGKTVSASTINKFINCPVDFILSVLEGYKEEDEVKDYFDEATYGYVVHEVLQNMYSSLKKGNNRLRVDKDIVKILDNEKVIMKFIVRSINDHYLRLGKNVDTPLGGDAEIMARLILPQIRMLLRHELDGIQYFDFIGAEIDNNVALRFPGGLTINIRYIIDRLDYVKFDDGHETYRIVDYKTGGDIVETKSLSDLFDCTLKSRPKAMLQLMLYANALAQHDPSIGPDASIMPQIFSFRAIASGSAPKPLIIEGQEVFDYKLFNARFMEMMETILISIFGHIDDDEDVVFTAVDNEHACKYCSFKPLCGKN